MMSREEYAQLLQEKEDRILDWERYGIVPSLESIRQEAML